MGVPPRQPTGYHGTAALWAAVPALVLGAMPAGLGCAAPAGDEDRRPAVSICVWRYHFRGESAFLSDLQQSYERQRGCKVELYQGEWRESGRKIQDWTRGDRSYAPDMVVVPEQQLCTVLGSAASLEGRLPSGFLDGLHPGALAQCRIEGVLVALPWMAAPRALYYNADRLADRGVAAPGTPADLLKAAQEVADPPACYGVGMPGSPSGGVADFYLSLLRGFGGVLFNDRGRLALAEEPGLRTLQLISDLVSAQATQPEVLTWTDQQLAELFLAGRVAMVVERPWLLRESLDRPPPFKVGVAPVPATEGGTDHVSTDCVIVFDTARDMDACVDFLQYALGRDMQRALAGLGVPSVRKDAVAALPGGEEWAVFGRALRSGRGPSPATWSAIIPLIEQLVFLTTSGRATPEEAIGAINVDLIDDPEYVRLGLPGPRPEGERRPAGQP